MVARLTAGPKHL